MITVRRAVHALLGVAVLSTAAAGRSTSREDKGATMLKTIELDYRRTASYTGLVKPSEAVRQAILAVPRHQFVPESLRDQAYENHPLPIGHDQTISQPYIVALMTDLLEVDGHSRVLEIGTGSGYQAAILASIVEHVYTIEIVEPLGRQATARLADLGYDNVSVRIGDGYAGWPEAAPFDGVIVTAGAAEVPPALVEQLRPGGRLVIPLGPSGGAQDLVVLEKSQDGSLQSRTVLPVSFVPFTRAPGAQ